MGDLDAPEVVLRDLLSSERRLRSLVEATAHFVWLATPGGALVSDMPLWRAITGQSREEILGAGWLDAIHPEDRERVGATWAEAVAAGTTYATEYRIRRAEGGWAWLQVRGAPVLGEDGEVLEFIGQAVDVTERRALELRLEQERRLLERVVEESPVGIAVMWGTDLRYVLINEAARALLPPGREVVGRTVAEAFPEVPPEIIEELHDVRRTGRGRRMPDVALPFGGPEELGGLRHYESRALPIAGEDGEVAGVLSVAVERTDDVLRERRLEQRAARDREVAHRLTAAIAADLPAEHPGYALAARLRPATADLPVGGDWYDAVRLRGGRLALVMGDVAGRGLLAATVMGQARLVLRSALLQPDTGPAAALEALTRFVDALPEGDGLLTALVAVADPAAGTLVLARAGHPPPLLRRASGEVLVLDEANAPPIGAGGPPPPETTVALGPGDVVLLFTDGLVERPGADLGAAIAAVGERLAAGGELGAIADDLLAGARPDDGRYDDVALLLAQVTG